MGWWKVIVNCYAHTHSGHLCYKNIDFIYKTITEAYAAAQEIEAYAEQKVTDDYLPRKASLEKYLLDHNGYIVVPEDIRYVEVTNILRDPAEWSVRPVHLDDVDPISLNTPVEEEDEITTIPSSQ